VPFEPTAFPSAGRKYLAYELYLTNFTNNPLVLSRVEVLDGDPAVLKPIAVFEGPQLDAVLQPVGVQAPADGGGVTHPLSPGGSMVVFLWVAFDPATQVPNKLRHRIVVADSAVEGAVIGTHHTELKVLRGPLLGADWQASTGNTIILDLGSGQFAHYFHLKPGSVHVKLGERVRRGQVMALIGASGDAREPHLHFEITNSPKFLAGDGLPYLIDHYRVKSENGWESRTRELPLKDMVIGFGQWAFAEASPGQQKRRGVVRARPLDRKSERAYSARSRC